MEVFRISKCKYIDDLTGFGAYMYGGRWNSEGQYMLYTSQTASLALLETLVHLPPHLAPDGFCILSLDIPDDDIETIKPSILPKFWDQYPNSFTTQHLGDDFLNKKKKMVLKVPSAILESEFNFLINPLHKNFKKVKIKLNQPLRIDKRLNK